jgi:hypothetical protein
MICREASIVNKQDFQGAMRVSGDIDVRIMCRITSLVYLRKVAKV